jgi:hypothetical protein
MHRQALRTMTALAAIAVMLIPLLFSCGHMGTTDIGDIAANPRKYVETEVTVSGEVTEVFSLLVLRYFVVRDKTGEITVITERPLPAKGEKISITGTVQEAFSIGSVTRLVIVEGPKKKG